MASTKILTRQEERSGKLNFGLPSAADRKKLNELVQAEVAKKEKTKQPKSLT